VHVANWPLFVLVLVASSLLAASGGLLLGTVIDAQHIQVLFALVLLPVTMLGWLATRTFTARVLT
jgi:uncharacterized membrane protein YfcA